VDFESSPKLTTPVVLPGIFDGSIAGGLSHKNDNPTLFKAHFIHQGFHQVDATAMNEPSIFGRCRIRDLLNIESLSLVFYSDGDFIRSTAATNIDVFSGILMVSVNDGVCKGFAQCNLDVALAFRNAPTLPHQEHELIHESQSHRLAKTAPLRGKGRIDYGLQSFAHFFDSPFRKPSRADRLDLRSAAINE
jgi:hypothetical protein